MGLTPVLLIDRFYTVAQLLSLFTVLLAKHTADDLTTYATVTTPGRKSYPWKNVPRWSKLYDKLQQQALHAGTDSLKSTSTDFERLPKDSSGPLAGQPENSLEIPETPIIALESMRRGGDDHSDDGNTLSVSPIFVDTGRPRLAECVVGCEHC
jgi:hypothetical protein